MCVPRLEGFPRSAGLRPRPFCRQGMSLLVMIFVVIVLLGLALYIVNLIPIAQPPFAKPLLMILCAAIAFFVIAERSGLLR